MDSFSQLKSYVFAQRPNVNIFEKDGPFRYEELRDFAIRINPSELLNSDVYFADHKDKAPLVIIQHGNRASKAVHREQGKRIATWGMHALVLSQPNQGRWMENGETLYRLVKLLHTWPSILGNRFDKENIIVTGHSFGGSAIAIASGKGAPIKGAIFLDPALVNNKVKKYLKLIDIPTILLGADKRIFKSRKRYEFFRLVPKNAIEVSIRGATHNDAQSPPLFSLRQIIGIEHATSKERQEMFTAAILASSFSLAVTGKNLYAWNSFLPEIRRGNLIRPKRK